MNPTLYMGLFLVGFALFASQPPTIIQAAAKPREPVTEPSLPVQPGKFKEPSAKLQNLYEKIKRDDLLQKNIDGITVEYQGDAVVIQLFSEELFESGEYSFREGWLRTLDRYAKIIKPEQKADIRIKVHAYADQNSPREFRPGDFGASDLTLSAMRAEWVARYLEREWGIQLKQKVQIIAHGAIPMGKRIDLELSYPL